MFTFACNQVENNLIFYNSLTTDTLLQLQKLNTTNLPEC